MLNGFAVYFQGLSIATALVLAGAVSLFAAEPPVLEGKWETAAVESLGKPEPKAEWVQLAWLVEGNKLAITMKGAGGQPDRIANYEMNATDGKIDIKNGTAGVVFCGLLKREGDSLVVALNASATRRPEKFESKGKGSADFVITFKPKK
jgi:uncharacterized protein (TIGR03067 family)